MLLSPTLLSSPSPVILKPTGVDLFPHLRTRLSIYLEIQDFQSLTGCIWGYTIFDFDRPLALTFQSELDVVNSDMLENRGEEIEMEDDKRDGQEAKEATMMDSSDEGSEMTEIYMGEGGDEVDRWIIKCRGRENKIPTLEVKKARKYRWR